MARFSDVIPIETQNECILSQPVDISLNVWLKYTFWYNCDNEAVLYAVIGFSP